MTQKVCKICGEVKDATVFNKNRTNTCKKCHNAMHAIRLKCNFIKEHHEETKYDPEHLTTEFIKKILRVECE